MKLPNALIRSRKKRTCSTSKVCDPHVLQRICIAPVCTCWSLVTTNCEASKQSRRCWGGVIRCEEFTIRYQLLKNRPREIMGTREFMFKQLGGRSLHRFNNSFTNSARVCSSMRRAMSKIDQ